MGLLLLFAMTHCYMLWSGINIFKINLITEIKRGEGLYSLFTTDKNLSTFRLN